jgi:Stress responsive A/B Barrel Domain
MIRHIVFFSVRDDENLETVFDGLSLLKGIAAAAKLEIGRNIKTDQLGTAVDFVVYGEFESEQALAEYKAHPLYQQSIDIVRPLRDMRVAADFVTAD